MLRLLYALLATARSSLRLQRELALENLALRQQLAILQPKTKRPRLTNADRAFWVALWRLWPDWQSALILVKPKTVISWHRKGFRFYWTWKSRHRGGRPRIDPEIRTLIRRMARENPTWGAPRVHGELLMLGFEIAQATVSRYMPRRRKPPSQNWRSFLRNHTHDLVSIEFFVVPTATFRVLYVFLVLERRRIVHFNVTDGPSAQWTGQQSVKSALALFSNFHPSLGCQFRQSLLGAPGAEQCDVLRPEPLLGDLHQLLERLIELLAEELDRSCGLSEPYPTRQVVDDATPTRV
jgi:putative transposase